MSKLMEITPSPESAVVPRVLVHLHRALDECFPESPDGNRQFTKTLVTGPSEDTAIGIPAHAAPEPPPTATAPSPPPVAKPPPQAAPQASASPSPSGMESQTPVAPVSMPTAELERELGGGADSRWKGPLAVVVLLAGAAALIYVFFFM